MSNAKRSRTRLWAVPLLIAVYSLCAAIPGRGQATTGQIVGQVTDPTGAVIPKATITAVDENKGVTFQGVTDESGRYSVLSMPPGTYSVTASAAGFAE